MRIYNKALSDQEINDLYMIAPSFDMQTAFTNMPILYGELPSRITKVDAVISGVVLSTTGTNAGTGKWRTLPYSTGFADGTYDVTLNYTNIYGKTGTLIYTNALTISTTGIQVIYSPATWTSGNVIATLT